MWMPKQRSMNPVVLVPKCPEGKHGHLQNMAMNGTARGGLGREERETEVVIISKIFFTPVFSSSCCLAFQNVPRSSQFVRCSHLEDVPSAFRCIKSLPDVCCHVHRTRSCWASCVLAPVSCHAVGAVEIHASYLLSHLKESKTHFRNEDFWLFSTENTPKRLHTPEPCSTEAAGLVALRTFAGEVMGPCLQPAAVPSSHSAVEPILHSAAARPFHFAAVPSFPGPSLSCKVLPQRRLAEPWHPDRPSIRSAVPSCSSAGLRSCCSGEPPLNHSAADPSWPFVTSSWRLPSPQPGLKNGMGRKDVSGILFCSYISLVKTNRNAIKTNNTH